MPDVVLPVPRPLPLDASSLLAAAYPYVYGAPPTPPPLNESGVGHSSHGPIEEGNYHHRPPNSLPAAEVPPSSTAADDRRKATTGPGGRGLGLAHVGAVASLLFDPTPPLSLSYQHMLAQALQEPRPSAIRAVRHWRFRHRFHLWALRTIVDAAALLLPRAASYAQLLLNDEEQLRRLTDIVLDLARCGGLLDAIGLLRPAVVERLQLTVEEGELSILPQATRSAAFAELRGRVCTAAEDVLAAEREYDERERHPRVPSPELSPLEAAVRALREAVQGDQRSGRTPWLADLLQGLDFSQLTDSTPIAVPDSQRLPALSADKGVAQEQLERELSHFTDSPVRDTNVRQLEDALQHLQALPEVTAEELIFKATCLIRLARWYLSLNTCNACPRALHYINCAISLLSHTAAAGQAENGEDEEERAPPQPNAAIVSTLHLCYALRGAVYQAWAALASRAGGAPEAAERPKRTRLDASFRDYSAVAEGLTDLTAYDVHQYDQCNFVVQARTAFAQRGPVEPRLMALADAVEADGDFGEGRLYRFILSVQLIHFHSFRLPHPQFVASVTANDALSAWAAFRSFIIAMSGAYQQEKQPLHVHVTLRGPRLEAALRLDHTGVAVNTEGHDFLRHMLLAGVRSARLLPEDVEARTAFGPSFSPDSLYTSLFAPLSPTRSTQRLAEASECLLRFDDFECATLYQASLCPEPLPQSSHMLELVRHSLTPQFLVQFVRLRLRLIRALMAFDGPEPLVPLRPPPLSEEATAVDLSSPVWSVVELQLSTALVHACHAESLCQRTLLLAGARKDFTVDLLRALKRLHVDALLLRARLYQRLGLYQCQSVDLEKAMETGARYFRLYRNYGLHLTLGVAYLRLGRVQQAQHQFQLIPRHLNGTTASLSRRAFIHSLKESPTRDEDEEDEGEEAQGQDAAAEDTNVDADVLPNSVNHLLRHLLVHDVQRECFQLLRRQFRLNSLQQAHREVPYWTTFVRQLAASTSLQSFVQLLLAEVENTGDVQAGNSLLLAHCANSAAVLSVGLRAELLTQLREYVIDAVRAYSVQQLELANQLADAEEEAARKVKAQDDFAHYTHDLRKLLRAGELTRPHSASNEDIAALADAFHLGANALTTEQAIVRLHSLTIAGEKAEAEANARYIPKKDEEPMEEAEEVKHGEEANPGGDEEEAEEGESEEGEEAVEEEEAPEAPPTTSAVMTAGAASYLRENLERAYAELAELLQAALPDPEPQWHSSGHVLQVTGSNLFLSTLIDRILQERSRGGSLLREVHILGLNVYIDLSFRCPGLNVGLGGEYVEWLMQQSAEGERQKITFDLSGNPGADAPQVPHAEPRHGQYAGQSGTPGANGQDAGGGQPGGDLVISSASRMEGYWPDVVDFINVCGGDGGKGSSGQPGGNAFSHNLDGDNGKKEWKRQNPDKDNPNDSTSHFKGDLFQFKGQPGQPGAYGGPGGSAGLGGAPGAAGKVEWLDKASEAEAQLGEEVVKRKPGQSGKDGGPAAGGKGGLGGADGLDLVIMKGGFFSKTHHKEGIRLRCRRNSDDRNPDRWIPDLTREESQRLNGRRDADAGEKGRGGEPSTQRAGQG